MFSVLLSVYSKEKPCSLKLSLQSIMEQTLLPSEIILVEDGPLTPELYAIIYSYKSKYNSIFKSVALAENVGLGDALNEGLKHCNNELVARMDTDDACYPERFEKQYNYLKENPDIAVLGSAVQEFNSEIGDLNQFRIMPLSYSEIQKFSKYRNPFNHPSVMFKKSVVLTVGSYMDMPLFEDYYLWIRILQAGFKVANIEDPLLHFRIGNDMIGRRQGMDYLKKEFKFLKKIKTIGYINNKEFIYSVISKSSVRLLPKKILSNIYRVFLRKTYFI